MESRIQKKIMDYLKNKEYYTVKVIAASRTGVPDILCCVKGYFVGLEVKTPQTVNSVTKLQEHNLRKIKESGGISHVVSSVEDVKIVLEGIENATI